MEKVTDYIGNFVYENSSLTYILTDEGRLVPDSSGFDCEYFIKDHLGNTRLTVKDSSGTAQIMSEAHYYPFGLEIKGLNYTSPLQKVANKYLYNGKELQDDFGLGWYDYGARFYDPIVPHFLTIDPLAEKYYPLSPYSYVAGNPIRFIDPDGMKIIWDKEMNAKEKRLLKKSFRQWRKSSDLYKNIWKSLKKSDYVYEINVKETVSGWPEFKGNEYHDFEMEDEETGDIDIMHFSRGKSDEPGGTISIDLSIIEGFGFTKAEKLNLISQGTLEEVVHAGQYDFYVHKYGNDIYDLPGMLDRETEAKAINGIILQQSRIGFSKGTDNILEKYGANLINENASIKDYKSKQKEWVGHPGTHKSYKRMKSNGFSPLFLIKVINK